MRISEVHMLKLTGPRFKSRDSHVGCHHYPKCHGLCHM